LEGEGEEAAARSAIWVLFAHPLTPHILVYKPKEIPHTVSSFVSLPRGCPRHAPPMGLDFYKFTKIYKAHKFVDKSLVIFCKRAGKQHFVKMRIKLKIKL
jgi:hypothetical protein